MIEYRISGYLVGMIWMPHVECWKDVNFIFQREHTTEPFKRVCDDLRDAMLQITNDGDFQWCAIVHGDLIVRKIDGSRARRIIHERVIPLERFKSVADMVIVDWDGPYEDDA